MQVSIVFALRRGRVDGGLGDKGEAYLQIRHRIRLGVGYGIRDRPRLNALIDLGLQGAVGERRRHEVEHAAADGSGRGVGACDDLDESLRLALPLIQAVADEGVLAVVSYLRFSHH